MFLIAVVLGLLFCSAESKAPSKRATVALCCRDSQVLDVEKRSCFHRANGTHSNDEPDEPLFKCPTAWISFTALQALDDALQKLMPNITQNQESYCVQPQDDGSTTVVYCQTPLVVRKCCPMGESVNRTAIDQCVSAISPFDATPFVEPSSVGNYEIRGNSSLRCDSDVNVYLPKLFVDNGFKVDGYGQLVVRGAIYEVLRNSSYYCIDQAVDSNGVEEPVAMICLAQKMDLMRFIIWTILPYTHFISAFFLLMTLLVYALLPKLRDNLQGYSLICFLICMIVVQTEYGVILALPLEPHTWCFSRVWIGTYFRYASSCWITCMGYNIWTKLSNGLEKLTKKETVVKFALCSLYAWGVPLLLITAVELYKLSLRGWVVGVSPPRRCWFGNPVLRHLLSAPNVVLVTLNLIFFIPSAIKVYGSLQFSRTAVSAIQLSKVEKRSYTAMFKLFLLMQFYTIPRIIHEIVDSDQAIPELLIVSVSLYQLIGPLMFAFFVCKQDVLKMIRLALVGLTRAPAQSTSDVKLSIDGQPKLKKAIRSSSYKVSSNPSTATPTPATSVESFSFSNDT